METTHNKQLPRDVFLYLLMVVALATAAANLGTILFQFINLHVPGAVGYYDGYSQGLIRWSVSSLVVVFPVLVWVLRFLKRDIAAHSAKGDLKIRKWLLYLTLFVTGVTVIGDLVTLVYSFMQGDVTTRFILKVAVVFWIAGSIFYYFLKELHDESPMGRRVVQWVTTALVAVALVGGFIAAGSPAMQRAINNDNQRIGDLQSIESQVIQYWQAKGKLPATLDDLSSTTIGGYKVPVDPLGVPYQYQAQSGLMYRICATFETSSVNGSDPQLPRSVYGGVGTWTHGKGNQCFDGTIDPAFYQPPPKPL